MGSGQWEVGNGRWLMEGGRWLVGSGQRALGGGQRAVGDGRWEVGGGQWEVVSGRWDGGGRLTSSVYNPPTHRLYQETMIIYSSLHLYHRETFSIHWSIQWSVHPLVCLSIGSSICL